MKTIFVFLLVGIHSLCTIAQTKEEITEYFDQNWRSTLTRSTAAFYRTVEKTETNYIVRDYFISGKIQMEAACSRYKPKMIQEGKTILYYENGNQREVGWFKEDIHIGLCKTFYEDGNLKKEIDYNNPKPVYIHYYAQNGEELLDHGNGLVKENSTDTDLQYYTEIEDSVALASFYINEATSDTLYAVSQKNAEYKKGVNEIRQDIGRNLKYPKNARRNGVEGVVYIRFIVSQTGQIEGAHVIKGIERECNEAALYAVSRLGQWIPAMHKNRAVKAVFVIPINFKLQ